MIKANIAKESFEIEASKNGNSGSLNGKTFLLDVIKAGQDKYHLIYNNQSININVLELADDGKNAKLKVNGKVVDVNLEDEFDLLLKNLGMSAKAGKKVNDIKAPMPGLVLRISSTEGQNIAKGEALLVLEAMKMENVIKAPTDVTIVKIHVNQGQAVEKGQLLMSFA